MVERLSSLGLCFLIVAPCLADELDYQPYWAHVSDIECPHFMYDCGGYRDLAVKGNAAYAVSEARGLQVVDISDPLTPVNRGFLPFNYNAEIGRLAVQDHYAFMGRQAPNAVAIVDVDDADAPVVVGSVPLAAAPRDLIGIGRKLYVATADALLHVYDSNVPTQPQLLLTITPPLGALRDLALDGSRLYAAGDGGLVVYSVASPGSPVLLGSFATDGTREYALAAQGGFALVAQGSQTRIIDVADPQTMSVVGTIPGYASGLLLTADEAWVGREACWPESNLDIYDLADPAQPQLLYQDGRDLRGAPRAMVETQGLVIAAEYICWCASEWPGFHVYRRGELPMPDPLVQLDVAGRSLAARADVLYVGTSGSIQAYDLAEPASPFALGTFGTGNEVMGLTATGERLLALESLGPNQPRRLQLYDLGPTWEPVARGAVTLGVDALAMAATGSHVLVAGGSSGGLTVIDVADPDAPVAVATHFPGETVIGVAASGGIAAVAFGAEVRLFDVNDPLAPAPLGVIPAEANHLRDELQFLNLAGRRYLLCAFNDDPYWFEHTDYAEIWDLTDPAQPARDLQVPLLASDFCRSLAWRDGVLYIQGTWNLTIYAWSGADRPRGFLGRVEGAAYSIASTTGALSAISYTSGLIVWPLQLASPTAVSPAPALAPARLALTVSPNPFNPRTRLSFTLPAAGPVDLAVHDLAGRLVRRLESGDLPAGNHVRVWDGDDAHGRPAPSGTYVCRLATAAGAETRKLVLVR